MNTLILNCSAKSSTSIRGTDKNRIRHRNFPLKQGSLHNPTNGLDLPEPLLPTNNIIEREFRDDSSLTFKSLVNCF
jgi:hypothetical protein